MSQRTCNSSLALNIDTRADSDSGTMMIGISFLRCCEEDVLARVGLDPCEWREVPGGDGFLGVFVLIPGAPPAA